MATPRQQRIDLIRQVAAGHGFTVAQVLGTSRAADLVRARWACMAAVWLEFGDGVTALGRLFNRDHTSVMHALRKLEAGL